MTSVIDPRRVSPAALGELERTAGAAAWTSTHWRSTEGIRLIALAGYREAEQPENAPAVDRPSAHLDDDGGVEPERTEGKERIMASESRTGIQTSRPELQSAGSTSQYEQDSKTTDKWDGGDGLVMQRRTSTGGISNSIRRSWRRFGNSCLRDDDAGGRAGGAQGDREHPNGIPSTDVGAHLDPRRPDLEHSVDRCSQAASALCVR